MNSELTTWLEYSKLQLASEAFLDLYMSGLQPLAKTLTDGNKHSSRFTPTEAATFATRSEVIAHQPNTGTGFSGTLFWNKLEHKYTLCFRSTEFVEDVLADSVGTTKALPNTAGPSARSPTWKTGGLT